MLAKTWTDKVERELFRGGAVTVGECDGHPVVDCARYEALVRIYGYVKYNAHTNVLMRGQTSCRGMMRASALRGDPPPREAAIRDGLEAFLTAIRDEMRVDTLPRQRPSTEPMLQHYGIRTRWLDLVDSIPHALYFAAHGVVQDGDGVLHPEPVSVAEAREHAYIYLINCGSDEELERVRVLEGNEVVPCRGIWRASDGFQLVDLRRAKPSKALRPHAQHGYLCRASPDAPDLWENRVLLKIRLRRFEAVRWLGNGGAFSFDSIFPSEVDDRYYQSFFASGVREFIEGWRSPERLSAGHNPPLRALTIGAGWAPSAGARRLKALTGRWKPSASQAGTWWHRALLP
jgi:hypothetical protein